jgi:hypothetical protein
MGLPGDGTVVPGESGAHLPMVLGVRPQHVGHGVARCSTFERRFQARSTPAAGGPATPRPPSARGRGDPEDASLRSMSALRVVRPGGRVADTVRCPTLTPVTSSGCRRTQWTSSPDPAVHDTITEVRRGCCIDPLSPHPKDRTPAGCSAPSPLRRRGRKASERVRDPTMGAGLASCRPSGRASWNPISLPRRNG